MAMPAPVMERSASPQRKTARAAISLHLDEAPGRLDGQDHLAGRLLRRDAGVALAWASPCFSTKGVRTYPGTDGVAGDVRLSAALQGDHLGQTDLAVLGRDVGGLERRGDQAVGRGDAENSSPSPSPFTRGRAAA